MGLLCSTLSTFYAKIRLAGSGPIRCANSKIGALAVPGANRASIPGRDEPDAFSPKLTERHPVLGESNCYAIDIDVQLAIRKHSHLHGTDSTVELSPHVSRHQLTTAAGRAISAHCLRNFEPAVCDVASCTTALLRGQLFRAAEGLILAVVEADWALFDTRPAEPASLVLTMIAPCCTSLTVQQRVPTTTAANTMGASVTYTVALP